MADPYNYKDAHRILVASVSDQTTYAEDWQGIAKGLKTLIHANGFSPKGRAVPDQIRARVAKRKNEAAILRAGANALRRTASPATTAGHRRALTLKTIRHLYLHTSLGKQKIWILNVPKALKAFPIEFASSSAETVDVVLNSTIERFDGKARKDLSHACQHGLAWVQKAMVVAGSPLSTENRKLFHRWFVPSGTANEDAVIKAWATTMLPKLQKIAFALKTGEVILTDAPHERGTNSSWSKSEAFTFSNSDLIAIYIEKAFFSRNNTLTGIVNWARIIVHELTHACVGTDDHSYSWQGLLPRAGDVFSAANDKRVSQDAGYPAVRALTLSQCQTNADSWAFFIADCAGALEQRDRVAALGGKLYQLAGEAMTKPVKDQLLDRGR